MTILSRIRDHNRRTGARVYNQMRLSFAIMSPAFVLSAALGLLGVGETRVNGEIATGSTRVIAELSLLAIGLILGIVRLTVFRQRRERE